MAPTADPGPSERQLVVILADISGYTRFMVETQLAAIHGQQCITFLIETILSEVDIPLQLQEIEGDAVFLYASHPGDEAGWRDVLVQVRTKLPRFFEVFMEGMVALGEATPCKCAVCRNVDALKLKVIVHSGRAVFHRIGGRAQVSGADVILAHRLLKNSVASHEYLLMSEAAYRDLGHEMAGPFIRGEERYEEFGRVPTHVQWMGEARERAREALYAMPDAALVSHLRRGHLNWGLRFLPRAIYDQIRRPAVEIGWAKRAGFVLRMIVAAPVELVRQLFAVPRRVAEKRMLRARAGPRRSAAD